MGCEVEVLDVKKLDFCSRFVKHQFEIISSLLYFRVFPK